MESTRFPGVKLVVPTPQRHAPSKPPLGDGPGTELLAIFKTLGAPECERCNEYARWMNGIGCAGCEERRNEIVGHLEDERKRLSWMQLMTAGALAIKHGLPFTLGGSVDEAIARARAKEGEAVKKKYPNGQVVADRDLIVDLTGRGWCRGLGDAITFAWIASGATVPIAFAAWAGQKVLLELLGQRVVDASLGVNASVCWQKERKDHSERSRFDIWSEALGVHAVPRRPPFPYVHRPTNRLVALAPECEWAARTWDRRNWDKLASELNNQGYVIQWILKEYGWHFPELADKISKCEFLIGNDSMPAHMAGTIGVPVLALFGEITGPRVLAHYSNVRGVRRPKIDQISVDDVLGELAAWTPRSSTPTIS